MNWRKWLDWALFALAFTFCLVTAVSAIHSNRWWIRILDFPRTSMLAAIIVLTVGTAVFTQRKRWLPRVLMIVSLLIAGGYQVWRIRDYTRLVATEMALDDRAGSDSACFTALGFNVLQHNRDYVRTIAMLAREQPDVVLLMEADQRWLAALESLLASYPHVLLRPLDNTYGMIFASRLEVRGAHFEQPTVANTPTVYATLVTRSGQLFDYVGLHPRPPLPGQNTATRDANIVGAARRNANDRNAAMAMGDFNDVAWSRTTQRFKSEGGYLDARVGRGLYATFPADHITFGWPLDQIFTTSHFTVGAVRVLDDVGSDHLPLAVRLCLRDPSAIR